MALNPLIPLALLALTAGAAHAGYACVDPADPEQRRWFQEQPCVAPLAHKPLPDVPVIVEAPRIPDGWGLGSAGSEWQVVGYDERGRVVGRWVEAGTSRPWISTDAVRVTGPRGGRGGRGRR